MIKVIITIILASVAIAWLRPCPTCGGCGLHYVCRPWFICHCPWRCVAPCEHCESTGKVPTEFGRARGDK